jgi:hypothetical protein
MPESTIECPACGKKFQPLHGGTLRQHRDSTGADCPCSGLIDPVLTVFGWKPRTEATGG